MCMLYNIIRNLHMYNLSNVSKISADHLTSKGAIEIFYLSVLDIREKFWRHGLLLLGDGGGELTLLDVLKPPELLHADLELAGPLDLGQFSKEDDIGGRHRRHLFKDEFQQKGLIKIFLISCVYFLF